MLGRVVRFALRLAIALLAMVALAVGGLLTWVTVPALPQRSGEIRLAALDAPVIVARDAAGIAHITATTPHDLFLAQGYVHAQERLWQMEIWRRIAAGRLSEVLGEATLDTDRFIRTLDWRGAAERDLQLLSEPTRLALEAYAEGVNAYLADHRGRLGLTFAIAGRSIEGYHPEPWTTLDSASFQKLQAWNLGGNMGTEIFRMLADGRLGGTARTDDLFPPYREDAPVITPTRESAVAETTVSQPGAGAAAEGGVERFSIDTTDVPGWRRLGTTATSIARLAGFTPAARLADRSGLGSNNWVVAPSRSANGGALLANDPHLGIAMPSVWFMNGLHCRPIGERCPYDVAGVSFASVPGVVLGHNGQVAWGATNVDPDVQDLFIETPDPDDPGRYLFRGESRPFEVRREEILVKGSDPVVLEVRATHHGPIVTDVDPRLADGPPIALRWTATAEPDGALESIFQLATVDSFAEFRDAFRGFGAPAQNFVYADVDGHIGYVLPGKIPIRDNGARGGRPADGASGEAEWTGLIPFEELPWQLDPASGVIVTANNAAVDGGYRHFIADEWDRGDRARRAVDLLDESDSAGITVEEMQAIQTDGTLLRPARIIPALQTTSPATADGRLVLEMIREWQGRATIENTGCAAYLVFELTALRRVFDDELGDLARDYVGGDSSIERFTELLGTPDDAWWDDIRTPEREDASATLAAALDEAGAELRATLGEPATWTWGRLHRAVFRDSTLGESGIAPIEFLLNHGPVPVNGAAGAVDNSDYDLSRVYPDPTNPDYAPVGIDRAFEVTVLPSYRLTIDVTRPDEARIIQTTGQSGHPFDHHYGDLIDDWQRGETVSLPFTSAAIELAATEVLTLRP